MVFLHGPNPYGSELYPAETWTDSTTGNFWPGFLADDLPTARIWLGGYNSSVAREVEEATIKQHANTLLSQLDRARRRNPVSLSGND